MATNNIYIGNRYVPLFANPVAWDNLREYEPLTIVTYEGMSYTSRKTVPVGTDISNTDYWVLTGNYNEQMNVLINQQKTLQDTYDTLNTKVSGFKATGISWDGFTLVLTDAEGF